MSKRKPALTFEEAEAKIFEIFREVRKADAEDGFKKSPHYKKVIGELALEAFGLRHRYQFMRQKYSYQFHILENEVYLTRTVSQLVEQGVKPRRFKRPWESKRPIHPIWLGPSFTF